MYEAKKSGPRPVSASSTQMNVPNNRSPGGRIHSPGVEDDPDEEVK